MNNTLAAIGINHLKLRKRALPPSARSCASTDYLLEGLYLALRPDLDQRDGEEAGLIGRIRASRWS